MPHEPLAAYGQPSFPQGFMKSNGYPQIIIKICDSSREELKVGPSEVFDPDYRVALFEFGYQRTLRGIVWKKFSELLDSTEVAELPGPN